MAERERELLRTIELLSEYGRAKLGGDWWPGNAGPFPRSAPTAARAAASPASSMRPLAYDQADLRAWVRGRGIAVRIARKGIKAADRLGRHRWVIERTMVWLTSYRRLTLRYERNASHFPGFLTLAATITCYKKLAKLTT